MGYYPPTNYAAGENKAEKVIHHGRDLQNRKPPQSQITRVFKCW